MPASVASAPSHRNVSKTPASRPRPKKSSMNGAANGATNGASQAAQQVRSPYEVMVGRIANRVAEMAENITFVERNQPQQQQQQTQESAAPKSRKPPRKLEMRLPASGSSPTNITFSAPFLDNTLSKMLSLQSRMLKVSNDIARAEDVEDSIKQEQFAQSAELSKIIALICAEKARQGA